MPRRSKRKAPGAAGTNLNLDKREETSPQRKKSMEDLPPEVVTIFLDHLTRNDSRNNILGYRRINSQWKDIIGSILERKITSGHLPAFPVIRIHPSNRNNTEDLLFVRQSTTMMPAFRNPFPSNSLLLYGKGGGITPNYFPDSIRNVKRMTLGDFLVNSGSYLTNLKLKHVVVPGASSIVTLLSSLSSLKVLRLETVHFDDKVIKPNLVFPSLPTLPNFTTLEVKLGQRFTNHDDPEPGRLDEIRHILYVWLIVSYADQLLHLKLETWKSLPALQRQMKYVYSFRDKTRLPIATTSDSAFRNLMELKVECPSQMFMCKSDLPKLQRISITRSRIESFNGRIQDVIDFISKCRILVHLRLDLNLEELEYEEGRWDGSRPPSIIGSPLPKLKTLEMRYFPRHDRSDEIKILKFLVLFPALETLHIIHFYYLDMAPVEERGTVDDDVGNADRIRVAKTRHDALEQSMYDRTMSYRQQRAAIPPGAHNRGELINELTKEFIAFRATSNDERTEIFKGLAAVGVQEQEVLLEQFLERQRVWNICPNLKLVSVSSGGQPDGDLCILRRPVVI